MPAYDLAVVREMLSQAFSIGEINTLAFDLFSNLYNDFAGSLSKSDRIEQIVMQAQRTDRVSELVNYVKDRNPHQYQRYANSLFQDPVNDLNQQRISDLRDHIARERDLLNQYRQQLTYASDPREIGRMEANIERQQQTLRRYQQEAAQLGATIDVAELSPPSVETGAEGAEDDEQLEYVAEEQDWYPAVFPRVDGLNDDQLARLQEEVEVVLMVATEVELRATLNKLEPYPRRKRILRAFIGAETYYLGKFGVYKTAVTRCGMGSGGERGATLATPDAIRNWKPRAIIMPGIAFGKDPGKQKMADVLVASQIIPYENQRLGQDKTSFRAAIPPSNAALQNRFENALDWHFERPDGQPCTLRPGPLLSGEKLVDNAQFKAFLFNSFPNAIGGEMEGAGLAAAAGRDATPWILAKAICDWGDGKKHGKHQPLAAAASVSLVHHILSQKNILPPR
ncbi:MAG: hypothetical protein KC423_07950 [Anaerolineales bacterium]|nr:hypothetical protein [Anaerolineales bacterium]